MLEDILIPLGAFLMVVCIIWLISRSKQLRAQYRAEVQKELIAKFSSGRELAEFLNTDGGRLMIQDSSGERNAKERTIRQVSAGVLLLFIGSSFFFRPNLFLPATVITFAGAGALVAALVSHVLSRKLSGSEPTSSTGSNT